MSAIRNLTYASSIKVLLNTSERFWETKYGIIGGASQMDLVNRQVYYPSDNATVSKERSSGPLKSVNAQFQRFAKKSISDSEVSHGAGVLVGSYCWGQDARRLGGLEPQARVDVVVEAIANIHPEIIEKGMVKEHASMFWDENKYAGAAFSFMRPGDFSSYYVDTIKPEGNLFFAGEHCSLDNGWIQGAIISSLRAVENLVERP